MISVVICTFNRADLLDICLETLVRQDAMAGSYEVIVVDNNSTDTTAEVARSYAARHAHVRYAFEPKQGLSNARNCGAAAAQGSYVAYVDDECKIPANWLRAAQAVIERHAPDMAGGPYAPWYRDPRPVWFKDSYAGIHNDTDSAGPLPPGRFVSGGNMLIRKELLNKLGGFDPAFGMNGDKIGYGEETSLQLRLRAEKPEAVIYYEPKLLLYHVVRPEKMRLWAMAGAVFAGGRDWSRMTAVASGPRPLEAVSRLVKVAGAAGLLVWHSSIGVLARDRQRFPFAANYLVERAFRFAGVLGAQLQLLRSSLYGRGPERVDNSVSASKESRV